MGEVVIGEDGEQYEKVTRKIDHLYGEVKYLRRPHASPLRYRIASDRVIAKDSEGSFLRMAIRRDVLARNDENSIDLYIWGESTTEDGEIIEGLVAVTQDENHIVTAIREVSTS